MFYRAMLHCTTLYHAMSYHILRFYVMLCHFDVATKSMYFLYFLTYYNDIAHTLVYYVLMYQLFLHLAYCMTAVLPKTPVRNAFF